MGYPQLCRIAPLALQKQEREKLWTVRQKFIEDLSDLGLDQSNFLT